MKEQRKRIILSSKSPRRIELLSGIGLEFEVHPSEVDESTIHAKKPREFALKAAFVKAMDVARLYDDALVIAADTIVVIDNRILGKPENKEAARKTLRMLSGRAHLVITGIAVCNAKTGSCLVDAVTTEVFFRPLTRSDIDDYVETGDSLDKAGAYGIQTIGDRFIEKIEGDYDNVVGLPTGKLMELLEGFSLKD